MTQKIENLLLTVQKPGRYCGGEPGSVVKEKEGRTRFAFCFPDTYEVGMSHLGMKILYGLLNSRDDVWCERVFAPWVDMERQMRANGVPLWGLESGDPIRDFDFIGFTLQYELSFTNVLNMLDLAGVPLHAEDRQGWSPIVIGGGPCACNPEPLAPFFDLIVLGEGEEVTCEIVDLYRQAKQQGLSRREFLGRAASIDGVYVPSLYEVSYHEDGTVDRIMPAEGVPEKVQKRIIRDMDKVFYPTQVVVPFIEVVHDRVMEEVFRGCIRGCRFCQAGFIYRPVREKSLETVQQQSRDLCASTGYEEISLSSLSTSDYTQIDPLLNEMIDWTQEKRINLALPSLRADNFSRQLAEKLSRVRKSGLTFAPEAGTQRLRDVINKNVTEEDVMSACRAAFSEGYTAVKLYFMLGLPFETLEDIEGIANLAQKVVDLFYSLPTKPKGKGVSVSVSVATFVPKPFTPFQWVAQNPQDQVQEKQKHLTSCVRSKKISVSWHDSKTSFLEAVFARGDRRLAKVLETAWKNGCTFDGWSERFHYDTWMDAFVQCGLAPEFYATRTRSTDEVLPWSHLDYGISPDFLKRELQAAKDAITTPNCRQQCSNCGIIRLEGGRCPCCG